MLNMKRYRRLQSTGEHKPWCGRQLNTVEGELECDSVTITRLRSEISAVDRALSIPEGREPRRLELLSTLRERDQHLEEAVVEAAIARHSDPPPVSDSAEEP
jgi:hypothetical protein